MKTNTPERLYLYPYHTDGIYEVETKPLEGTSEYIQTDAFVEKATEWIEKNFNMPDDFKEHFKNAMKV